jgi:probable metal-binding protein
MNLIHGHEVLQMMLASDKAFTKTSLLQEVNNKFGSDARFYTCSAENLTAEQLIDFLDSKGKLVWQSGAFQTSPDLLCKH